MVHERTERQLVDSAIAYCEWRAGSAWRRRSNPEDRNHPDNRDYSAAARLLHETFYVFDGTGKKPPQRALPVASPRAFIEADLSRPALADLLIRENPETEWNRATLLGFSREKLLRLVMEKRRAVSA